MVACQTIVNTMALFGRVAARMQDASVADYPPPVNNPNQEKHKMPNQSGRFVWHDLMTTDTEGAKKFYSKVAGWGTQAWEGSSPYTLWTTGGVPIGGVTA